MDATASESGVGGPLLPQLPAAWQKKQKSRSKLKWSLKCPQSAEEDFWPGYGTLAKGRLSFLARQKSHETGQINPSAFLLEKQNSNETRYLHSLYI